MSNRPDRKGTNGEMVTIVAVLAVCAMTFVWFFMVPRITAQFKSVNPNLNYAQGASGS